MDRVKFPHLVMIGWEDEESRPRDCEELAHRQSGAAMTFVGFPGAYHGFAEPLWGTGKTLRGYRAEFNASAAEMSLAQAQDFWRNTCCTSRAAGDHLKAAAAGP